MKVHIIVRMLKKEWVYSECEEKRNMLKVLVGKSEESRQIGRTRRSD
jgi:hypothetical protein